MKTLATLMVAASVVALALQPQPVFAGGHYHGHGGGHGDGWAVVGGILAGAVLADVLLSPPPPRVVYATPVYPAPPVVYGVGYYPSAYAPPTVAYSAGYYPQPSAAPAPQCHTVWIANPNGSRTSVVLRAADGGQWVGPQGEYYDSFPTETQLASVYGLAGVEPPSTAQAPVAAATEKVVWILNANGSKTKVVLQPGEGGTWVGPKDEVYETVPTADQLRPAYGVANADAAGQNAPAPNNNAPAPAK